MNVDSNIEVTIWKERYGSLDGLDVSNSLDIFAESKFCWACYSNENKLLSLLNASYMYLLNAPTWTPRVN